MSFSRLLARIFMVPIGLILALLAAGLFLGFALTALDPTASADPAFGSAVSVFSGLVFASFLGSFAFYPAIIGLIVAEVFSWRSIWFYLAFGLCLSFFATRSPHEPMDSLALALDVRALATGLVGGFVYWLVSGRGAGITRRTLDNRPKAL